ncbi:TPA: NUDIX domain-containing protein [Neisseria gonorrhoeae]|uniref:NUDIX domain-containing protein n=1 Tax=Neisseria gonorrhoeae TaxID=485 RepID=UPI000DFE69D5|nr:NUDIX domain-containing protein [Neisseria gonorrhoeae]MBT8014503.1 NUDIX domain-containing protein [Neisseria gonorrhoeae]MBT8018301.1 NUDIX domain-containing protein [Neisseria gonorrhoeae]MCH8720883.1 NUDIX domain-containing protein [Neisseria gonorrhoeae]MCU9911984.1 NUDIX domain-containing protein [Neisseria gonorrhoeae]MCU9915891.1 NUDIX domain-containing protein [Neisseria gonorrhoeae]
MIQDTRPLIRVVAGILLDSDGNYLLGSRPEGKPYAGYWEFAGGKVEAGETDFQALQREFGEELGIRILAATPWLTKIHSYEHARVCLKFLWVNPDQWEGGPQSREGQEWSWQKAGDFTVAPMLPANGALLRSLSVPRRLYGSLKTGLHGENSMGAYRVLPLGSAGGSGANVLMEAAQWQDRSEHAGSVWMMVQTREQWRQAQEKGADVAVWRVCDDVQAQEAAEALRQGVSVPLVLAANGQTVARYGKLWLGLGAHAVVRDETIGKNHE